MIMQRRHRHQRSLGRVSKLSTDVYGNSSSLHDAGGKAETFALLPPKDGRTLSGEEEGVYLRAEAPKPTFSDSLHLKWTSRREKRF
ncbi:hypothetical protein PO124_31440 [Bacillus licheniformis]|nr:hypothetical protein [Bacillus licheniformis]